MSCIRKSRMGERRRRANTAAEFARLVTERVRRQSGGKFERKASWIVSNQGGGTHNGNACTRNGDPAEHESAVGAGFPQDDARAARFIQTRCHLRERLQHDTVPRRQCLRRCIALLDTAWSGDQFVQVPSVGVTRLPSCGPLPMTQTVPPYRLHVVGPVARKKIPRWMNLVAPVQKPGRQRCRPEGQRAQV